MRAILCSALLLLVGCQRSAPDDRSARVGTKPTPHVASRAQAPAAPTVQRHERATTLVRMCIDAEGKRSYQDRACPGGTREISSRVVEHETEAQRRRAAASLARAREEAAKMAQIAHGNPRGPVLPAQSPRASVSNHARCAAVRAAIQRERDEHWMRIKHDRLREHDEMIREACGVDRRGG